MNHRTLLQAFEWYLPDDTNHWNWLASKASYFSEIGLTDLWLPPAYKGTSGIHDVGYGVYDMYDLGEFLQKDAIPTKYGTKDAYLQAINTLHAHSLRILGDVVFNHRMGADASEWIPAVKEASDDRLRNISDTNVIEAWTKFTFPNRHQKYSDFEWNHTHFDGVDWDQKTHTNAVYRMLDKTWDQEVDTEFHNYDYLMGADLDFSNQEVLDELDHWGAWYLSMTNIDGFRLDAVKHIHFTFFTHWLTKLRKNTGSELFAVGEYWSPSLEKLTHYLDACGHVMSLFDVPLHFHFHEASNAGGYYDMRHILDGTLVQSRPELAVTFVDNHDTQPGQALQSFVASWFKPLAYALILLRNSGTPCVFFGDLFGIPHDQIQAVSSLETMLKLRQSHAHGMQTDYFDHPDIIGWTRSGLSEDPCTGMAVIMSDGPGGSKKMCVGIHHASQTFIDALHNCNQEITLDSVGCGIFPVEGGSVSVWIPKQEKEHLL